MKFRFTLPMICAVACAGMMFGSSRMAAQSTLPFTVQLEETTTNITPGGAHQFNLMVTNTSAQDISMRVVRVANGLPGEDWSSSICFGGLCYDASTSAPQPATIKPGMSSSCELTITGGMQLGQTAEVTLRFAAGFSNDFVEKTLMATTSEASGVPDIAGTISLAPAYPNPAVSYAFLPVPTGVSAKSATLGLYNVRGERMADLSTDLRQAIESGAGSVRLDLAGLPSGAYLYRLTIDGREISRTLNIVR